MMKNTRNNTATPWKIVSAILAVALIAVCCTWAVTSNSSPAIQPASDTTVTENTTPTDAQDAQTDELSLWTEDAPLKAELTAYMATITDENSADFIPVENRIAVFDMDGTLCCETDPGYFDHKLLYHRVMEDPDYKDKASDEEKATCEIIKEYLIPAVIPRVWTSSTVPPSRLPSRA